MKKVIVSMIALCTVWLLAVPAAAQQTTGAISGRIVDDQGAAVPGATVSVKSQETGFARTAASDAEGVFRLAALPVGTYDLLAELQGFTKVESKGIVVNVGQTLDLNFTLKLATVQETITVSGETPLIQTSQSSVGGVVDMSRIENLPLNGRQFANAAITIPGVALGFHSDPTKSTQYSPQIAGGNGRNVNYQIDGGDNNDDTVGGLLQLFPLEAIQEFNFVTQRYKAEYGRSNGGVMNIVTKSGTNAWKGSWFTSGRDKALNAKTMTEKIGTVVAGVRTELPKGEYQRYQYGGSFGGPIVKNKAHFFAAYERTKQDTTQSVNTLGLFPGEDGVFATPSRENLFTAKASTNLTSSQYMSVRYGRNTNSAGLQRADAPGADELGRQQEPVQLDQRESQLGARRHQAERVRVPVRRLLQSHRRPHRRGTEHLPERRPHRRQRQHAAVDGAAQVPVPRRLLVGRDGHGRPGPRVQGRDQLHPRAAPLRHVRVGQQGRTPTRT